MTTLASSSAQAEELVISNLSVSIDSEEGRLDAITDVTFSLRVGEVVGLVGESGSGKSLLCRAIIGLLAPRISVDGSVSIGGRETVGISETERRGLWGKTFAMVFQDPMTALSPVKTIGAQLVQPIRHNLGLSPKAAQDRALELVRAVGIPDPQRRLTQYPQELSGGMRQRIVIALAMSAHPLFLFADEPTTALDVTVQAQVLDLLDHQRRDGPAGVILCSHDLSVVAGRTDMVIVMYAGQIVEMAPTSALFEHPHMPYTEALLQSIPRIDQPPHTRLRAIPGRPPSIADRPAGCRFAPRCPYATAKCETQMPPLVATADGHQYRCWYPRNSPQPLASDVGPVTPTKES